MNQDFFTHRSSFLKIICSFFLLLSATVCIQAQSRQVTGRVTVANSDSVLSGVSIRVKGSNNGTISGNDGTFSINAPGNGVLVFSIVGFTDQETAVNNRSNISVSMSSDVESLQQVVVIGYGTQKRKDLTGSVASVSAATIEKVPVISASQALQGRAAGVQVTNNDGAPGGNISVLIRGTGSLASYGNEPLYVVDGYPISGGLNSVNPSDIASIDVLKDASATAIYGIRAANGVVIITTKKGVKGKTEISVDAYNAFQSTPKKYDLLNARDFATLSNDVEASDSTKSYHGLAIWHTPDALHNVDWQDALYRGGLTQNYTIGIRGGSDKIQSAMSAGFYDQKGIVLGSYFKRFTLNANLDFQPVKWLRSSTSAKYSYQDANTPFGTGSLYQLAVNPPTLDSGNRATYQIKDGNGNYGFFNPIDPNVSKFSNPVYSIETNQSKNITNYFLATTSLEATIFSGLRIRTNAGVNSNNFSGSFYQPQDNRANLQNSAAIITLANYHQNLNQTFEWLWENTIAYDKTFGKHTINFVGGISAQKNTNTLMGGGGVPPNSTVRDLGQVSNLKLDAYGNGEQTYSLESQFARLTYNFDDKYLITGTVRRDGSSRFDTGHKYGVFPSGAIAWRIKEESFLQGVNWLSDLKLRGSYGVVGNQVAIGLFQYQALYSGNFPSTYNGNVNNNGINVDNFGYPFNKVYQTGIAPTQPANHGLKWETDYQTDIGLDAGFLKGALTFTVDYYRRKSKDFLLTLAAPAQTGFLYLTRNVGAMTNTGVEFALNYNGNKGKDFQYSAGLTVATNKNKLTSITSGTNYVYNNGGLALTDGRWTQFSRSDIGAPVGEFYGYKALGVFQTQAQIDALNAKAPGGVYWRGGVQPGDRYYADINGDGIVNADSDRVALGNPQPKFYGGLNLDFSYKSFDINLYFYGVYGNKILNYNESNLEDFQKRGSEGVQNVGQEYYDNRWTPDNPSNRYTKARAVDDAIGNYVPSSVFVENGSFLKLKNLTIGYRLPDNLIRQATLSRVRVYVSTQNLFVITKYSGLDPEIGTQNGNATQNGVDNGVYPPSRFFTVGLNVTL